LCVNEYCTTTNGCQSNCSLIIIIIIQIKYVIGEDIGLYVPVPSKATGKIKILFRILVFIFVERTEKDKLLSTAATHNQYNP
jgi:hypothetical protein